MSTLLADLNYRGKHYIAIGAAARRHAQIFTAFLISKLILPRVMRLRACSKLKKYAVLNNFMLPQLYFVFPQRHICVDVLTFADATVVQLHHQRHIYVLTDFDNHEKKECLSTPSLNAYRLFYVYKNNKLLIAYVCIG